MLNSTLHLELSRNSSVHKKTSRATTSASTQAPPAWEDPLLSTNLTPVVDVWATALRKVDRDVNTGGNILHHDFPFPDPLQVVQVESGDWFVRYLANWMMIRQVWVWEIDSGRVGYPFAKFWQEILNGLPQFITVTNQDDPAYAGYRQISWLLPPPWDEGLMITKQSVKNHEVHQAALAFLGVSKQQFQMLQCQVPEEVHFHDRSWRTEEVRAMPSEEVCAIFWELTELS